MEDAVKRERPVVTVKPTPIAVVVPQSVVQRPIVADVSN
jgi:hypothetical protein